MKKFYNLEARKGQVSLAVLGMRRCYVHSNTTRFKVFSLSK